MKPKDPPSSSSDSRKFLIDAKEVLETETASAVFLLLAAVAAIVWANLSGSYNDLWESKLSFSIGGLEAARDLRHWVDEGLMAIFFFVVALEVKREVLTGELKGGRRAALPVIAALGGMIVPAVLYLLVNFGGDASPGWGIPVATDIAFALGVVALFAPGLPQAARVFLLSLAIVDDIGAILVIAVAYSSGLVWSNLALACAGLLLIAVLRRFGIGFWPVYLLVGVAVWAATLGSGVHATIAGVALGFVTPVTRRGDSPSAGERFEDVLHPWTTFLVLPVFALANAGIEISGNTLGDASSSRVTVGVLLGLVVGKPLGICGAVMLGRKLGMVDLPEGTDARQILGLSIVAGIGFTVSLFIADLAFESPAHVREATIGVVAASVLASLIGGALLHERADRGGKIKV